MLSNLHVKRWKMPPVGSKRFHRNTERQSVGRKWYNEGEDRRDPQAETDRLVQEKETRKQEKVCGRYTQSFIHMRTSVGGEKNEEYDSRFVIMIHVLVTKQRNWNLAPLPFFFRSRRRCDSLSACAYVCARVGARVKVCVIALPHGLHAGRGELLNSSLQQSTAAGGHRSSLGLRRHHPHRRVVRRLPEVSGTF